MQINLYLTFILAIFMIAYFAPWESSIFVITFLFAIWHVCFIKELLSEPVRSAKMTALMPIFVCVLFLAPAILALFSPNLTYTSYKFSVESVPKETINFILLNVLVGMQSFSFGWYGLNAKSSSYCQAPTPTPDYKSGADTILALGLFISFCGAAALRYSQAKFIFENGFSSLYTEGVPGNVFLTLLTYVFYALAPVTYVVTKRIKLRRFVVALIFIEAIAHSSIGQRVWFIFGLIQIYYLTQYATEGRSKIQASGSHRTFTAIAKYGAGLIVFVIAMQFALNLREGNSGFDVSDIKFLADFLVGQTGTFTSFALSTWHHDYVYSSIVPPIFDPIYFAREAIQSSVSVYTTNIGSRITFLSCETCFFDGRSYGSSAFTQLYQFFLPGVMIGMYFAGRLSRFILISRKHSVYFFIIGYFLIRHLIWLPRSDLLPHYILLSTGFLALVLMWLVNRLFKIRRRLDVRSDL